MKIVRSFLKSLFFPASIVCLFILAVPAAHARETGEPVRIVHTQWSSSIASANLVKAVLQEKLGIACQLVAATADRMWEAVAQGEADATLSAWLPHTHARYQQEFKGRFVDLGANLEGTRTGLVVPDVTLGRLTAGTGIRNQPYITINSIPELKEHAEKFNHRIIGIEPEAGIMHQTRKAMEVYGLEDFRLVESSEVAMMAELSHAIRHQKWIVVTGWLPHWSFARWSLKFLEDPENVYGDRGGIHTLVREGLPEKRAEVCAFLDRFHWEPQDLGQLMLWIEEDKGRFPYEKALRWMRTHPQKVEQWLD